jgi:hypothetical protein
MFRKRFFIAAVLVVVATSPFAPAGPKERPRVTLGESSTEPKGIPLELTIGCDSVEPLEVHTGGDPAHIYQENIEKGAKTGHPLTGSVVELFMEIKNTGREAITIWVSGDVTLLTLDLQGNGARKAEAKLPRPKNTIPPKAVTIQPGKSYQMPLFSLSHGFRNEEKHAYVTEGGTYILTATFKTGISPAPKQTTRPLQNGFGEVILKSGQYKFLAVRPS